MMRILVVSKRQYTGKDLLDDRYGRLFELPAALARAGSSVRGVCLSYRRRPEGEHRWDGEGDLRWRSLNAFPRGAGFPGLLARTARDFRPDVIWASSDVPMVCAGAWLAARTGIPLVADLYDNYESFGLSHLPGAVQALRFACRRANRITVVSHALGDYVRAAYGTQAAIELLGNGVRADLFHPGDRIAARRELGLPERARLVGTAGALVRGRGIRDLLLAHARLAAEDPDLHLVLAGPRDDSLARCAGERVLDLGVLPHERVGTLFRALDVGVICNRDSAFGRYCFPLKLHEMLACGIPVVAASVGDVRGYLAERPGSLYPPGDVTSLADGLRVQLSGQVPTPRLIPDDWEAVALRLKSVLDAAVGQGAGGNPRPASG